MSTTNQIADALEKSGIPFTRVEGVADGIEYWGLTVIHENIHAEVRECSGWVEMKVWHYTPEQFMNMLTGVGTCHMKLMENMHTSAYQDMYECDECGEQVLRETYMGESEPPRFCPNCGRRCIEWEVTE